MMTTRAENGNTARTPMFDTLTYVTGNPGKVKRFSHYIDYPLLHKDLDLLEIQSLESAEIIEHKAREAYRHIQAPILVEDTSLQFLALGKLPGPFIKWFYAELGTEGLCKLLADSQDRSALASVHIGLYDGHALRIFTSACEGTIAPTPRGNGGFGWDPIFIPSGYHQTWAEMPESQYLATSMSTQALQDLATYLKTPR
ncbi:non-canonical purine NTP pyrophosphatase [Ktedonobacter sp. SOSP1-52]|uniref:non-canonical purine NTP pyrophosphatase n=1 Tax=Ktedonobacter sp. SOSP1-52 TaxID=2778366 RepID=UPI001915FE0C|nr:non-canonical purine NTP pyrophosphatase [Ktedonobacter sp. SOSP1-52]GHO61969.1 non-canonical purine NTP pyrophosphatase [Ktedonobacter sp. SOSP1-52]